MLKKEEIYVPVSSKEQAEKYRKVLKAMGEPIGQGYYIDIWDKEQDQLSINSTEKWVCGCGFSGKKQITFGQLIDLLSTPAKIAVKVDNEKEFNALMKYYDSLGYVWNGGAKPMNKKNLNMYPNSIKFEDKFQHSVGEENKDYQIIPFADFAKDKGIKLPRITTFDGVDLFNGDRLISVNIDGLYIGNDDFVINEIDSFLPTHHYFSTKKSALDWIEAQKPKSITVELFTLRVNAICHPDKVIIKDLYDESSVVIFKEKLAEINKAMEELK